MKVTDEDYKKGVRIAREIGSVMQSGGGVCDLENYEEIKSWLYENETSWKAIERLSGEEAFSKLVTDFSRNDVDEQTSKFLDSVREMEKKRRVRSGIIKFAACAAAVMFAITFLIYSPFFDSDIQLAENMPAGEPLEMPLLILRSGEIIELGNTTSKVQTIAKSSLLPESSQAGDPYYNSVITPRKQTHTILLEDGTKVTLNANSELKYPDKFGDQIREVFLKGEGFFEVSKDAKPFIVKVEDVTVTVYGTKFNINSYNQRDIQTTLLQGSVGVAPQKEPTKEILLLPSEMASYNNQTHLIEVTSCEVENVLSWMNGYFSCTKEPLQKLLTQISTWYGVDFSLEKESTGELILSVFQLRKDLDLDTLLQILEGTIDIKIEKMKGGTYLVK